MRSLRRAAPHTALFLFCIVMSSCGGYPSRVNPGHPEARLVRSVPAGDVNSVSAESSADYTAAANAAAAEVGAAAGGRSEAVLAPVLVVAAAVGVPLLARAAAGWVRGFPFIKRFGN